MPSSWESVCNLALSRIGLEDITSLSDDLARAIACRVAYQNVVDEVLLGHDWVCARHQKDLAALATFPVYKFDYQYILPVNPYCLRVREVANLAELPIKYQMMGRYILCDEPDGVYLSYIKRITDPAELDGILANCISLRLASWIEPRFGDSITRRKSILEEYGGLILQAKIEGAAHDYADDETERSADTENGNSDWSQAGR